MQTILGPLVANSLPSCCAAADFGLVWLPKRQQEQRQKGRKRRERAAKPTPAAKEHVGITALEQSWNNNNTCSMLSLAAALSPRALAMPVREWQGSNCDGDGDWGSDSERRVGAADRLELCALYGTLGWDQLTLWARRVQFVRSFVCALARFAESVTKATSRLTRLEHDYYHRDHVDDDDRLIWRLNVSRVNCGKRQQQQQQQQKLWNELFVQGRPKGNPKKSKKRNK